MYNGLYVAVSYTHLCTTYIVTLTSLGARDGTLDSAAAQSTVTKRRYNADIASVVSAMTDLPALVTHAFVRLVETVKATIKRLSDVVPLCDVPSAHSGLVTVLSTVTFRLLQATTLQSVSLMTSTGAVRTASKTRLICIVAPARIALEPGLQQKAWPVVVISALALIIIVIIRGL